MKNYHDFQCAFLGTKHPTRFLSISSISRKTSDSITPNQRSGDFYQPATQRWAVETGNCIYFASPYVSLVRNNNTTPHYASLLFWSCTQIERSLCWSFFLSLACSGGCYSHWHNQWWKKVQHDNIAVSLSIWLACRVLVFTGTRLNRCGQIRPHGDKPTLVVVMSCHLLCIIPEPIATYFHLDTRGNLQ